MRTQLAVIGTLATGLTVLAPTWGVADDKTKAGIGPIQSIQDVQDTAKMLFKLADTNNDGRDFSEGSDGCRQPDGRRFFLSS